MNKTKIKDTAIKSKDSVDFYELEKVRFIIKDALDLEIGYAYDDLVFSEHGLFIIQFDKKKSDSLLCWFNSECNDTDRYAIFKSLTTSVNLNNMKITYKGKFEMEQKGEKEEISIRFKVAYRLGE